MTSVSAHSDKQLSLELNCLTGEVQEIVLDLPGFLCRRRLVQL